MALTNAILTIDSTGFAALLRHGPGAAPRKIVAAIVFLGGCSMLKGKELAATT
jgi:hypothetical protein